MEIQEQTLVQIGQEQTLTVPAQVRRIAELSRSGTSGAGELFHSVDSSAEGAHAHHASLERAAAELAAILQAPDRRALPSQRCNL